MRIVEGVERLLRSLTLKLYYIHDVMWCDHTQYELHESNFSIEIQRILTEPNTDCFSLSILSAIYIYICSIEAYISTSTLPLPIYVYIKYEDCKIVKRTTRDVPCRGRVNLYVYVTKLPYSSARIMQCIVYELPFQYNHVNYTVLLLLVLLLYTQQ